MSEMAAKSSFDGIPGREDTVLGYMDLVDFECELGGAHDGNRVYPSVEAVKKYNGCWEYCGIVEVEVRAVRIVHPGTERS